jgi:hypothetical protein
MVAPYGRRIRTQFWSALCHRMVCGWMISRIDGRWRGQSSYRPPLSGALGAVFGPPLLLGHLEICDTVHARRTPPPLGRCRELIAPKVPNWAAPLRQYALLSGRGVRSWTDRAIMVAGPCVSGTNDMIGLLTPAEYNDCVEQAYRMHGEGRYYMDPKGHIVVHRFISGKRRPRLHSVE